MDTTSATMSQQQSAIVSPNATIKIIYSPPSSPAIPNGDRLTSGNSAAATSSPASGANGANGANGVTIPNNSTTPTPASTLLLSTPKKHLYDAVTLQIIREKLRTPGGVCELQTLRLEAGAEPVNVIKDRYLISTQPSQISAAAAAKTPASYRHLIDLTASNLKCTDVFTEEQFLCKIINEPLHKVQRAYFQLEQEQQESCRSTIYGHSLIRGVHDIVALSSQRTYVIIAAVPQQQFEGFAADEAEAKYGVYEDLHTYIRNKRRLGEPEARALFHQICQTVQVCHRNGIILRDLKLKRFYFIDEARTKLQYESLEGSMILDSPSDDTLSDKIGCPLYTAPELLCPVPTYRGKPADMWSLGVILYTMLVGQYPFYEKGNCNLITIIRHCHVQIPSTLSRSVRWLLLALLRKNYEERMQAEHIFFAPWIKEQQPFYMQIRYDVYVPDDDDDDVAAQPVVNTTNSGSSCGSCASVVSEGSECTSSYQCRVMSSSSASSTQSDACVQPLDYSRTTLQMECDDDDADVEMG